jgi:ATP-binding cassette subfamily B protein
MSVESELLDDESFARYVGQPARLPMPVRRLAHGALGGKVVLYAFVDLDEQLRFCERWLVLGEHAVAVVESGFVSSFPRSAVKTLSNEAGLSCRVLRLHGEPGRAPLAELRFTQRQRRAVDAITSVLEQALEARTVAIPEADRAYQDAVFGPVREAQALVTPNKLAVVWRLLSYLGRYRTRVALGTTAAVAIAVLSMLPPLITGRLVDRVIGPVQRGAAVAPEVVRWAWLGVLAMGAVYVVRQLCLWARLRLMAELGELVAGDLRDEVYAHLQRLSMSFFSRKKTGSLITRVSSDTDRLWEFLAFGVVEVSLSLVMLVCLGAVLISLDAALGLVMTAPVPLLCFAIYRNGQSMERLFVRAWRKWSLVTDLLSDTIPGMRVVKAFNRESHENRRFSARNHDVVGEFNRIHAVWTSFWPRLTFGIQLTALAVWAFALPRLLGAHSAFGAPLSLGTFVSFLLYSAMFVQPIETVGQVARILHRATTSAHRVFEVLDTKPEVVDRADPVRPGTLRGEVELRDVTFSYDGIRQVLRGVSFHVRPGELIGLVGPSGGGKTTLANLLTRFYDVTSGQVLVDGVDLRDFEQGAYRQQVGIVLQDPYLFHGSVLENLRYGMPGATLDQVIEAARAANVHDFVCKLPLGYDTIVGERGHTLSGGERQRVSIARAILRDPRILILDEATSAVDTETEQKIQQAMDRLVAGRTVFAIAHRLSTLHRASRLFVIENGKVVEQGTHAELLALPDGTYRKLFTLQQELHHAA